MDRLLDESIACLYETPKGRFINIPADDPEVQRIIQMEMPKRSRISNRAFTITERKYIHAKGQYESSKNDYKRVEERLVEWTRNFTAREVVYKVALKMLEKRKQTEQEVKKIDAEVIRHEKELEVLKSKKRKLHQVHHSSESFAYIYIYKMQQPPLPRAPPGRRLVCIYVNGLGLSEDTSAHIDEIRRKTNNAPCIHFPNDTISEEKLTELFNTMYKFQFMSLFLEKEIWAWWKVEPVPILSTSQWHNSSIQSLIRVYNSI